MSVAEVAALPFVSAPEGAIVELRREAVDAVARQKRLDEEAATVRAQAAEVEDEARRAFARGEDRLARHILARGLCTLETRERLERELAESRRAVVRLLGTIVRTENRAWRAGRF
jgi:phage shock protein A